MWEEWRYEIDRSLREAEMSRRSTTEPDAASAEKSPFRLFTLSTDRRGRSRGGIPATLRLDPGASRARPIL